MRLCVFDDYRLGAVVDGGVVDLTAALPWPHDPDPQTAGWWRRLCRDYPTLAGRLAEAAASGRVVPIDRVRLRAPVVNPSKVVAAASNYADHVHEMHAVQDRTLGKVEEWMMSFDVFLKAPSSIVGPHEPIVLPREVLADKREVHHESELVIVIGTGGRHIPAAKALEHVLGYTIGLDMTVRSPGDRSRRKSYDTFSPLGPWITTADESGPSDNFDINLTVNGATRQRVNTADLLVPVPAIIERSSAVMTLLPGDVIFTGAPPGVGPIEPGDNLVAEISGLGVLHSTVTAERPS